MPVNAGPHVAVTAYQQPVVVKHDALGIRGGARGTTLPASAARGRVAGRAMARRGGRVPLTFAGVTLAASCLLLAQVSGTASLALLIVAYAIFGAGYGAVNTVIAAVAVAGMTAAQAGVAGGITSAGRQAGQSLGVSVTGAVFAAGLHGPLQEGFSHASYPAWLVMAGCGTAVLLLGMATHRQARRGIGHRTDGALVREAA